MTSVLFVRLSSMGDVVHGLGAIAALHCVRPDWPLSFVTQSTFAPLVEGIPGVKRVLTFDRRGGIAGLLRLRAAMRALHFDLALDLQGNWKSGLVAALSGARERIGMAAGWRQEPCSRILLHRTVECAAVPHPARAAFELVRTVAPDVTFLPPRLVATPGEVEFERAELARIGIVVDRPFTVVVRTDPRDPRALRPEIVNGITSASGGAVVHVFGPAERDLLESPGIAALRHESGQVRRLIALGALVTSAGGEVIGPDQGASHVLAAAGAPCRILFGATDPLRTAPPSAAALLHPQPPTCQPCGQRRCSHPQGVVCMQFAPRDGRRVDLGWPRG